MNPNNRWHPQQVELCRQLADSGLTGKEIAYRLGKSRSAVLGFISRNKIKLHGKQHGIRNKITIVNEIDNIISLHQPVKMPPVGFSKWGGSSVSLFPRIEPPQASQSRNWPSTCQFIAGEARERIFCGEPVNKGTSWCETHRILCFQNIAKNR